MAEQFLSKAGLTRLVDKLKGTFAGLDSPHFSGSPTVLTPSFERTTDSKEVINKEYASKLFEKMENYIKTEAAYRFEVTIKPSDWEYMSEVYTWSGFKFLFSTSDFYKSMSFSMQVNYLEMGPLDAMDLYKNRVVSISRDGMVYLFGEEKPAYELPLIFNVWQSQDITEELGEMFT